MKDELHDIISTGKTIPPNMPHIVIRPIHYAPGGKPTACFDHDSAPSGAFGVYIHHADNTEKCLLEFKIISSKPVTGKNFDSHEALDAFWKAKAKAESLLNKKYVFISTGASFENMKKLLFSDNAYKLSRRAAAGRQVTKSIRPYRTEVSR